MTEQTRVVIIGPRVAPGVDRWIATARVGDTTQTLDATVGSYGEAVALAEANDCGLNLDHIIEAQMIAAGVGPQTDT